MSKKSDVGYFSDSRLRALSITAIALTDIQTIPINTFTSEGAGCCNADILFYITHLFLKAQLEQVFAQPWL